VIWETLDFWTWFPMKRTARTTAMIATVRMMRFLFVPGES
jgi:hypothetical protein